jgi:hypothetical protein
VNESNPESTATAEVIAHVLGRAHREAQARHAPDEARAILHVAHSLADALGEMDPRFDRARFIQTSNESIYGAGVG